MATFYKLLAVVFLCTGVLPAVVVAVQLFATPINGGETAYSRFGSEAYAIPALVLWVGFFCAIGAFFHVAGCVVQYVETARD